MTVVSVAFDGTRLSEAESESDGGTWDQWGTKNSPTQEVDWPYQLGSSSAAISNQATNGEDGVDFDATIAYDYSSGPKVVLALVCVTTFGLLDTTIHGGLKYYIGSSGSDWWAYYIFGSKRAYDPPTGGWVTLAIDPNETAYLAATNGSPAIGSIDYYGVQATTTDSVKSDNVGHDSLCYLTVGDGLTLTAGTGTDPEGVFTDFVDYDQGTVANRWNVCQAIQGALIVHGWLNIGSGATTEFADAGAVVIWTESYTAEGFNGLLFDLGSASTVISATDCFFQSKGRGFAKDFFHTQDDVDQPGEGQEIITGLDSTKDWQDLDYVIYSDEGGSDTIGLTEGVSYWIAWDGAGWGVYTSRDAAATNGTRVALTDGSSGEQHSFKKDPDTRADLTVSGSTGTSVTLDGSSVDNCRNVTLTVKTSAQGCKFTGCDAIDVEGANLTGSVVSGYNGEADTSALIWNENLDPNGELDDLTITKSVTAHHAITFGTTAPLTMNLTGWTTSGFNASDAQDDSTFLFADRGSDVTWTVNISGGTGNFSYKKVRAGDTVNINTAVTVTFDKMKDNTEVRIFKTSDDSVVDGIENATAGTPDNRSFAWSASASTDVYYRIISKAYVNIGVYGYIVPSTNTTIDIAQRLDLNYANP